MVPVRLLHAGAIGEGPFPVRVPVIRAGAVEAGVDQDGEVFEVGHVAGTGVSPGKRGGGSLNLIASLGLQQLN